MHVAVVAAGELPADHLDEVALMMGQVDLVIAADGGLDHCRTLAIWPDVLVGDLDSADPQTVVDAKANGVDVRRFPTDKDATDLDLALSLAQDEGATAITVVAPFGGRLDHELASIGLLTSPRWSAIQVVATDGRRTLWVVRDTVTLREPVDQTISLLPAGSDASGVSIDGVQWPLSNATLPLGSTWGVSNLCREPAQTVSVTSGIVLAVVDRH